MGLRTATPLRRIASTDSHDWDGVYKALLGNSQPMIVIRWILLALLWGFAASGADTMPYHLRRDIGGTNYNLAPLYEWRAKLLPADAAYQAARQKAVESGAEASKTGPGYPESSRRRNAQEFSADLRVAEAAMSKLVSIGKARPLPDWVGGDVWDTFTVEQVWNPDLLLLRVQHTKSSAEIVLKNYPLQPSVTDGEPLQFFALRVGNHQWTNRLAGTVHTLPLFDYGMLPLPPNSLPATTRQQEKGK